MAEHFVTITLVDDDHAVPTLNGRPLNETLMTVGDTVHYETDPGGLKFEVVFEDGSPFQTATIQSREPQTLVTRGRFFCKCFITRNDGVKVGWRLDEDPESGGDHDVRPRS